MPINIRDTLYMLAAVEELPIQQTFIRDRYFPTNKNLDIFGSAKVLADYKEGGRKMADFVLPRVGAISVARGGFSTYELEPGNISVSIPLTEDQLRSRGFGESLMSGLTPAERSRTMLMGDLAELSDRISRREELTAAQTILNNGCIMRHETGVKDVYEDVPVKFYDGDSNPAEFKPTAPWEHSKMVNGEWKLGNWILDVVAMVRFLISRGRSATDLVVSQDVGVFIMEDPWVIAMLDNRRAEMGRIDPRVLTENVAYLGTFNFLGHNLNIIIDYETYEDKDDKDTPYLEDETVFVTAPGCGRGLYGGVTQLEADGEYHTHAGRRVPLYVFTMKPPCKENQLTAKPLFVPNRINPWCVAKKVLSGGD